MFNSANEALVHLKKLNLPPVFADLWEGKGPARFRRQFSLPVRFFKVKGELRDAIPQIDRYIPILERNREAIYAYDTNSGEFVEYYYGDSAPTLIGQRYQQFIGWLFADLGIAGLESVVEEVSADFDFKYLTDLKNFLREEDEMHTNDAKRRFVTRLE